MIQEGVVDDPDHGSFLVDKSEGDTDERESVYKVGSSYKLG